jgi:nicotinamidase-related amidase
MPRSALIVIDMINHCDHPDAEALAGSVERALPQMVLYPALDGYVRHFDVAVAGDATAHIHEDLARAALRMMELDMSAEVATAEENRLS